MSALALVLALPIVLAAPEAETTAAESAHAENSVLARLLKEGIQVDGQTVSFPEPRLRDGQSADEQRAALRENAGSEQALQNLLRDSVTAPYVLKVHDVKGSETIVRVIDLEFVVYAELKGLDPKKEAERSDGRSVEAGNMAFQIRLLKADDLKAAGAAPARGSSKGTDQETWHAHVQGRLLDRIEFGATNEVVATHSENSIVIASRTDPAFSKGPNGPNANHWWSVPKPGDGSSPSENTARKPYAGGASYAKITKLGFQPGALHVELHAAFAEPREWFRGAPILRSKFGVVAQDQIRSLRRELAKRRAN